MEEKLSRHLLNQAMYLVISTKIVGLSLLVNTAYGAELSDTREDNIPARIYTPNAEFFTKFIGPRKFVEFNYMHPLIIYRSTFTNSRFKTQI